MTDQNHDERLDKALEAIDGSKRGFMRKLVVGAAFVPPVVASFAINGMTVSAAHAVGDSSSSNISDSSSGNTPS